MRAEKKNSLTLVNVMVGFGILLVLSGLFVPYFVRPSSKVAATPLAQVSAPK